MLSEEGVVKIVDFGVAELIENEIGKCVEGLYGSYSYYLPVIYMALNAPYTVKFDIFSLGVWMLVISRGHCPQVYIDANKLPGKHIEDMSSLDDGHLLKPFILQCMKKDHKERPSAAAVHSFIESQVVSCNT